MNVSASRNMFENKIDRYADGRTNDPAFQTQQIVSQEIENKLRLDVKKFSGKWKYSYGGMLQYVKFNNNGFTVISNATINSTGAIITPAQRFSFSSAIEFFKYGVHGDVTRKMAGDRLTITLGLRLDGNTFTTSGNDVWKTFSPRLAGSYALTSSLNLNATVGRYYRLPSYTVLGFRDGAGNLANQSANYIGVDHYVAGIEWLPTNTSRITLEGFYKQYFDYPVSKLTGTSIANTGTEFGAVGNEPVNSNGKGRAYGFEVFYQQKLSKRFFTTISYTFFYSKFSGADGKYIASAWDTRHLLSFIAGYKFNKGWELGLKHRFAGGSPYTPFDMPVSQSNYLITGKGIPNYSQLNTQRLGNFNQTDIRIDKKWNFKRITLDVFLDIQNVLRIASPAYPTYLFKRTPDNSGWATTDGQPIRIDGSNGIPYLQENFNDSFLPTFGFILEF
jgi:hypothetical protein